MSPLLNRLKVTEIQDNKKNTKSSRFYHLTQNQEFCILSVSFLHVNQTLEPKGLPHAATRWQCWVCFPTSGGGSKLHACGEPSTKGNPLELTLLPAKNKI